MLDADQTAPALAVENIHKSFGSVEVLKLSLIHI